MMGRTEYIVEIGKRIAELREAAGMSQAELAHKLRVQRENISKWERGVQDIRTKHITALAAVLNTNCDFLLTGVSTQNIDFSQESGLTEATIQKVCKRRSELSAQEPELLRAIDSLVNDLLRSEHLIDIAAAYAAFKQGHSLGADYVRFMLLNCVHRALDSIQTIGGTTNGIQRTAKP